MLRDQFYSATKQMSQIQELKEFQSRQMGNGSKPSIWAISKRIHELTAHSWYRKEMSRIWITWERMHFFFNSSKSSVLLGVSDLSWLRRNQSCLSMSGRFVPTPKVHASFCSEIYIYFHFPSLGKSHGWPPLGSGKAPQVTAGIPSLPCVLDFNLIVLPGYSTYPGDITLW